MLTHEEEHDQLWKYWMFDVKCMDSPNDKIEKTFEESDTEIYAYYGNHTNAPHTNCTSCIKVLFHKHKNGNLSSIYNLYGFHEINLNNRSEPAQILVDDKPTDEEMDFF